MSLPWNPLHSDFWHSNDKTRDLSSDPKAVYAYAFSNGDVSASGIYFLDLERVSEGVGFAFDPPGRGDPLERVKRALNELARRELVYLDPRTSVVFVRAKFKRAAVSSPNHTRAIGNEFLLAPTVPYWRQFWKRQRIERAFLEKPLTKGNKAGYRKCEEFKGRLGHCVDGPEDPPYPSIEELTGAAGGELGVDLEEAGITRSVPGLKDLLTDLEDPKTLRMLEGVELARLPEDLEEIDARKPDPQHCGICESPLEISYYAGRRECPYEIVCPGCDLSVAISFEAIEKAAVSEVDLEDLRRSLTIGEKQALVVRASALPDLPFSCPCGERFNLPAMAEGEYVENCPICGSPFTLEVRESLDPESLPEALQTTDIDGADLPGASSETRPPDGVSPPVVTPEKQALAVSPPGKGLPLSRVEENTSVEDSTLLSPDSIAEAAGRKPWKQLDDRTVYDRTLEHFNDIEPTLDELLDDGGNGRDELSEDDRVALEDLKADGDIEIRKNRIRQATEDFVDRTAHKIEIGGVSIEDLFSGPNLTKAAPETIEKGEALLGDLGIKKPQDPEPTSESRNTATDEAAQKRLEELRAKSGSTAPESGESPPGPKPPRPVESVLPKPPEIGDSLGIVGYSQELAKLVASGKLENKKRDELLDEVRKAHS